MAKPKLPNQKKKYYQLERRTMRYLQLIHSIYETHTREASRIALLTDYDKGGGKPFRFEDYPQTRYAVEQLQMSFAGSLQATIVSGIDAEWENADLAHEQFMDIVRKRMRGVLTEKRLNERFAKIYSNREGALEAFKKRSDRGLNLSSRVWNQSEDYRRGLETVLSVGIEKGMSAVTLSKRVSKYLNDFDEIKDDYKQLFGKATTIKDCEFNSQRLARTEINMAYRTAEQRRWQEEDYIVGFEVKRGRRLKNDKGETGDYPCAVCSMLKGRYPKDFKFVGWHPMCRCYVVPIMKTDEEFFADTPAKESVNYVGDVPENFKRWFLDNRERAKGWSNMPYFVKDNKKYIDNFQANIYTPAERKFTRTHRTKEAMSFVLNNLQNKYPNIKNTEIASIYEYTRGDISDFRQLNKQLRDGNLSDYNVAFSELLSSALAKLSPKEAEVYRTIRLNKTKLKEYIQYADKKKIINYAGFTSTSNDFEVVAEFMNRKSVKIKKNEKDILLVINSKSGRPISDFSMFNGDNGLPNQHELLIDKGSKFRFDNYKINEEGIYIFYMTEC